MIDYIKDVDQILLDLYIGMSNGVQILEMVKIFCSRSLTWYCTTNHFHLLIIHGANDMANHITTRMCISSTTAIRIKKISRQCVRELGHRVGKVLERAKRQTIQL